MVFSATYNNISLIPWLSVLLPEEIGVPGENQRPHMPQSLTSIRLRPRRPPTIQEANKLTPMQTINV
jgi:hypothetical protein